MHLCTLVADGQLAEPDADAQYGHHLPQSLLQHARGSGRAGDSAGRRGRGHRRQPRHAWQKALEDVGPTGADKGKGGKYLITPPGFAGNVPDGYIVLPSDTFQGFVILRSNFRSRSRAGIADGKQIRFYPLSARPESTVYVDMYDKPFDATIPYDASFFASLDRMIQIEPWLTRDKVMIDLLNHKRPPGRRRKP